MKEVDEGFEAPDFSKVPKEQIIIEVQNKTPMNKIKKIEENIDAPNFGFDDFYTP